MSIESDIEFERIEQDDFHEVDQAVMRHVFEIHNTIGRFLDERIYRDELTRRCRNDGMQVHREAQLKVCHKSFSQPYYLDLLVQRGIVYELKTVERLTTVHEKQLINYLLLAGLSHGKLVNFRSSSVESRFISTNLDHLKRSRFRLVENDWDGMDDASCRLRVVLLELLDDWGAFLEANLYRRALLHLLDGFGAGFLPVEILVSGQVLGTQEMCLLSLDTGWHVSAIRRNVRHYETHIRRLIAHTPLVRVQWINFNLDTVTLRTVRK